MLLEGGQGRLLRLGLFVLAVSQPLGVEELLASEMCVSQMQSMASCCSLDCLDHFYVWKITILGQGPTGFPSAVGSGRGKIGASKC